MAILKSADGKFYDVPDNQLDSLVVPAEQVKEKLEAAGVPTGGGSRRGAIRLQTAPQVFIQVFGGAKPRRGGAPVKLQPCAQEGEVAAYHNCGAHCGEYCGTSRCGSSRCGSSRCGTSRCGGGHCGHCGFHCW